MFDAVIDVLSQNSATTLKTVRIVIFQPQMLNDFCTSMKQREAVVAKPASWIGSTMSKIKCENLAENDPQVRISFFAFKKFTRVIFVFLL